MNVSFTKAILSDTDPKPLEQQFTLQPTVLMTHISLNWKWTEVPILTHQSVFSFNKFTF